MYTKLVKTGIMTMEHLMRVLVVNPRTRFGIPLGNDFSVWKLDEAFVVNPDEFLSMGKATPFEGWELYGKCYLTVCDGKVVYQA